jgi:hypothetical protein
VIYAAMGFSLGVELLNIRARSKRLAGRTGAGLEQLGQGPSPTH